MEESDISRKPRQLRSAEPRQFRRRSTDDIQLKIDSIELFLRVLIPLDFGCFMMNGRFNPKKAAISIVGR